MSGWRTAGRATAAAVCCAAVRGASSRRASVPARASVAAPAIGSTTTVFACRGRLIKSCSFIFLHPGAAWGRSPPEIAVVASSDDGERGSRRTGSGGGVDVRLRAVAGFPRWGSSRGGKSPCWGICCSTDPAASLSEHRWRVLARGRGLFAIEVVPTIAPTSTSDDRSGAGRSSGCGFVFPSLGGWRF